MTSTSTSRIVSLACAAIVGMTTLSLSTPSRAEVDIYNRDDVSYRVTLVSDSGSTTRRIDSGAAWKKACDRCVVVVTPAVTDQWRDEIAASGEDVVTIENGSLRIGEGSRN